VAKLEFDDEGSRLVEEFNASAGATARRLKIMEALALKPGWRILDVGSGPGHQVFEYLADPHLPQSLGRKLADAGFKNVRAEPVVHVATDYNPSSVSAILMKFVVGYVVSQGISQSEADAWAGDPRALGSSGDYFFNHNEYIFTADKP